MCMHCNACLGVMMHLHQGLGRVAAVFVAGTELTAIGSCTFEKLDGSAVCGAALQRLEQHTHKGTQCTYVPVLVGARTHMHVHTH